MRGSVADLDEHPLVGASVTVTPVSGGAARTVLSDSAGRFRIVFLDGEGEYTVLVRLIGFSPSLRRGSRSGLSNIIEVNPRLARTALQLAPLQATAPPLARPQRERGSVGGISRDAATNTPFLLDPTDINALVQFLPGVFARGDSGYSVLGAAPDQNGALLDGIEFDGSVPPDAACSVRFATTTSDPSRGQFAGGQSSITSCHGQDFTAAALRATITDPHLAWADPQSLQQPSQVANISGGVSGPIRTGQAHYQLSAIASHSAIDAITLLSTDATRLRAYGFPADSVAAFLAAVTQRGIPATIAAIPTNISGTSATVQATLDWKIGTTSSWVATLNGTSSSRDGVGLSPLALPTSAGASHTSNGRLFLHGSNYLFGVVDELTASLSASTTTGNPYIALPGGIVQVGTVNPDGAGGIGALRFGGPAATGNGSTTQGSIRNEFSLPGSASGHHVTFGQQVTLNSRRAAQRVDTLGQYTYQSIADLAANRPAAYVRDFAFDAPSNRLTSTAFWLGDSWRLSNALSVEGGLRADHVSVQTSPGYNAAVDSLFGIRTDRIPASTGFSPRLGFAWLLKRTGMGTMTDRKTGETIRTISVESMDGSPQLRQNSGAGTTLFGDIGAYRGTLPIGRVLSLQQRTGLPGASSRLTCLGDATPLPDWSSAAASVFDSCRDGSPALASSSASVAALVPGFVPPTDWKANIGLNKDLHLGHLEASIVLLREVHTASTVDANLSRTPVFTLASESGRPVYASPSSIVPATGLIAPDADRLSTRFTSVLVTQSDLHRSALQFNAEYAAPPLGIVPALIFTYSYNRQWNQARGLDGSTAGDPTVVSSQGGEQPLHQLTIGTSAPLHLWWFRTSVRVNILSGTAYTPTVAGDINGDGFNNDRAFVPTATAAGDSTLARQVRELLASAPASARSCLQQQAGAIAGANSCRGPWRAQLDFNLEFAPPMRASLGQRLHLTATFLNAGATLLRLVGARPP